jgi:hypothetical protein
VLKYQCSDALDFLLSTVLNTSPTTRRAPGNGGPLPRPPPSRLGALKPPPLLLETTRPRVPRSRESETSPLARRVHLAALLPGAAVSWAGGCVRAPPTGANPGREQWRRPWRPRCALGSLPPACPRPAAMATRRGCPHKAPGDCSAPAAASVPGALVRPFPVSFLPAPL